MHFYVYVNITVKVDLFFEQWLKISDECKCLSIKPSTLVFKIYLLTCIRFCEVFVDSRQLFDFSKSFISMNHGPWSMEVFNQWLFWPPLMIWNLVVFQLQAGCLKQLWIVFNSPWEYLEGTRMEMIFICYFYNLSTMLYVLDMWMTFHSILKFNF